MATIGTAYVQILPSTEGIAGNIAKALGGEAETAGEDAGKKSGKSFSTSLKKAIGGATAVTVAATGALAAAGGAVVGAAKKTAEYGDLIDKNSQKLGVSSQFYQEWDAVLQHSGTSMDSMGSTFKKLATVSQNATKDQQAAFEALGLSMDQVSSMSAEELFTNIVTGLQGMDDTTERTALATTLLGRNATEMGALFNTSAEDTQAMIENVHELGGVMSDSAVKDSAAFQDAMQDFQTSISGASNGLMAQLIPHLTTFVNFLTANMPAISSAVGTAVAAIMPIIQKVISFVIAHMPQIQSVIKAVASGVAAAFKIIAKIIPPVLSGVKSFVTGAVSAFNNFMSAANSLASKVTTIFNKIKTTISNAVSKIKNAFNFKWSLPKLKLPHISVTGGKAPYGIGGAGSLPKFSIKWNKEGGIFNSDAIVGYGVGEAGAEAIVPLNKFWNKLDALTASVQNNNTYGGGVLNLLLTMDGSTIAKSTIEYINGQTIRYNVSPLLG